LTPYGEVLNIHHETWSNIYRYKVPNGIRNALTSIKKHVPSRIFIGGHRATITYEGQPPTCFGCNGADHQYQQCPNRKQRATQKKRTTSTWADIVQKGHSNPKTTVHTKEKRDGMKKPSTTQQDIQKITTQETTGIMEISADKETQEEIPSKEIGEEERKEEERPTPAKIDSRKEQMNWADDQEQETPMDTAIHTTDTQSTAEGAGEATGVEITGKEEIKQDDTQLMHDPRQTDNETAQPVGKTSPKRIKKLNTDREAPYQQSQTRSKTRATKPPTIAMTQ